MSALAPLDSGESDRQMVAAIALSGVRKVYADGTVAVDGIDLEVAEGEFVTLLGPTGCGKTTILRIVAGLETLTAGEVWLGGRPIDEASARERRGGGGFPELALFPPPPPRHNNR